MHKFLHEMNFKKIANRERKKEREPKLNEFDCGHNNIKNNEDGHDEKRKKKIKKKKRVQSRKKERIDKNLHRTSLSMSKWNRSVRWS